MIFDESLAEWGTWWFNDYQVRERDPRTMVAMELAMSCLLHTRRSRLLVPRLAR